MNTRIKTDVAEEILTYDKAANFIKFEDDNAAEKLLIEDMIAAVRTHCEIRTGLSFVEKTYETFFRHDETPYLLPISPVIAISKVETIDYLGAKTELTLNSDYFKKGFYDIEIIPSSMTGYANPLTNDGSWYDLFVTYTAGYGHADTEALPIDLLEAMKRQIAQWYDNRDDFKELNILGGIDKILLKYRTLFV